MTINKTRKQLEKYKKILINNKATDIMLEKINQKITQDPTIVQKRHEESIFLETRSESASSDGQLSLATSTLTIDTASIKSVQVKEKKKRGRPKKVKPEQNIIFE